MAFENLGGSALDYYPCRYGKSKLLFRGPKRKLDQPYLAVLGGTETYGKFCAKPYPALLEEQLDFSAVNLGCVNAGVDVFANEQAIADICSNARVTVVEITGAQNLSNRFYAVHPRRNDRFLRASNLLKTIYREVDFSDINFTRHLLKVLWEASPDKFAMVEAELKEAWTARMKRLISNFEGKVVLLWLADHAPGAPTAFTPDDPDPLFVDRDMIEMLRPFVAGIAEVVVDQAEIVQGRAGLIHGEVEAPVAAELLGTCAHDKAAAALAEIVRPLL